MSTDLKSIARLGPVACAMLLAGTLGIVLGGPTALAIFQSQLDPQTWKGLAALSGSWIGGTSNMVAIKVGVQCPDDILAPLIVIDSVVGYGWMSIMIALSGQQDRVDTLNRANRAVLDDLNQRLAKFKKMNSRPITLASFAIMLGTGFVASWTCMRMGGMIPSLGSVLGQYTYGDLARGGGGTRAVIHSGAEAGKRRRFIGRIWRAVSAHGHHGSRRESLGAGFRPTIVGGRRVVDHDSSDSARNLRRDRSPPVCFPGSGSRFHCTFRDP